MWGPGARANVRVCLKPLGPYDKKLLNISKTGIEYLYGFEVHLLKPGKLPRNAWYPKRRRWRAEKLLDHLDSIANREEGCRFVVGFTRADISTTKGRYEDWGIFGLGTIGGPSAVVSTFRLGRRMKNRRKLAIRTVKVVNHELGHALGLEHNPQKGCLMEDAKGTIRTVDRESGLLCDDFLKRVEHLHGVTLPVIERFDWSKVIKPK